MNFLTALAPFGCDIWATVEGIRNSAINPHAASQARKPEFRGIN
jgi:hypothetical protein